MELCMCVWGGVRGISSLVLGPGGHGYLLLGRGREKEASPQ